MQQSVAKKPSSFNPVFNLVAYFRNKNSGRKRISPYKDGEQWFAGADESFQRIVRKHAEEFARANSPLTLEKYLEMDLAPFVGNCLKSIHEAVWAEARGTYSEGARQERFMEGAKDAMKRLGYNDSDTYDLILMGLLPSASEKN